MGMSTYLQEYSDGVREKPPGTVVKVLAGVLALAGLFAVYRYNFLLYHTLVELFSVTVAWSLFLIALNTRWISDNDGLVFLGTAYFFVSLIDVLHTAVYKGTGVLPDHLAANPATQLWIAARFLEAFALLIFPVFLGRRARYWPVFICLACISGLVAASILAWDVFPDCYIEGQGLTLFKKTAEYVIAGILVIAIIALTLRRSYLADDIYIMMLFSMVFTIMAELAFTFYVSVYGLSNVLGHLFKIISFFLVYLALIRSTLNRPYSTLFRNLQQERLLQEEQRNLLDSIFAATPDCFVLTDGDGVYQYVNPGFCSLLGRTKEEILGRVDTDFHQPEQAETFRRMDREVIETGAQRNLQISLTGPGGQRWYNIVKTPVRNAQNLVSGVLSSLTDITRAKEREMVMDARLRLLQTGDSGSLHSLLQATLEEVEKLTGSRIGFYHFVNTDQQMLSLQAWSPNTVATMCRATEEKAHYPISKAGVWVDCVHRRRPVVHNDYANLAHRKGFPEGHAPVVRELVVPVLRGENIVAILGVGNKATDYTEQDIDLATSLADLAWDIAEGRRARQELLESERKYRQVVNTMSEVMMVIDEEGTVIFLNDNAARNFSRTSAGSGVGRNIREFLPVAEAEAVLSDFAAVVDGGQTVKGEMQLSVADGERWFLNALHPIRFGSDSATSVLAFFLDITDRKHAEIEQEKLFKQLNQAQKMESVGRLAGGVAHDFNNMLSIIIGNAEMAQESVDFGHPVRGNLQEILKAAERSANLTRQLLAFARKQEVTPKVLDLNGSISGMLKMLWRLIGEDIDLVWIPGADLWPVKIDPSQLDQILANLCVNARDAISGVGKINIRTANAVLDEQFCREHPGSVQGEYVQLVVSDTGCGMDREMQKNIFEPFFTTKSMDRGTGLGLSTVFGILKQNHGFIDVQSEPGRGTSFTMYLPRYRGRAKQFETIPSDALSATGSETILLVEDEPTILELTRKMLEHLGYEVLSASTPGEAIQLAEGYNGLIDLLMTDVIMPEMNGRDLARIIAVLFPDIKQLFMSGYTADIIAHHGVLDAGVQFVQKPFSKNTLATRVRETLAGS
jgi:PAS domain S-box-containing protein